MLQILFRGIDSRGVVVYRVCVALRGGACALGSSYRVEGPPGVRQEGACMPAWGLVVGVLGCWEVVALGGAQRGAEGFVQVRAYAHHSHLGHLSIYVMSCSPLILYSFHP